MPKIIALLSNHSDQVSPGVSLREVAARMLQTGTSSVIVVDGGVAAGIITERDLLRVMRQHGSPEQSVGDLMSRPVHSVTADTDFREAYRQAASLDIRRIVVTDPAGRPLGIVNESDFRKHLGPDFFMHLNNVDSLMEQSFPRLPADAALDDALIAMEAVHGSCAVVVDGRRPLGVVTEHDVVRLFLSGDDNPSLAAVMTSPTVSIGADQPLSEAAQRMLDHGIRHLTVVDDQGQLVGLLSEHALMSPLKLDLIDGALSERKSLALSREQLLEETALRERYQRALLDNFPFLVWLKDTESRILTANRAYAEASGRPTTDELIGKTDLDVWPLDLATRYRRDDTEVMATRQNKIVVEPIVVGDQAVWHETYKAPVIDEAGNLLGTVGFAQDISERKNTALRLEIEHDLAQSLAIGLDREHLTSVLLKAMLRFPEFSAGGIYRALPDGSYGLLSHEGLSPEFVHQALLFAADSPFARQASLGRPACLSAEDEALPTGSGLIDASPLHQDGFRSVVQLPILRDGQPDTCLLLASRLTAHTSPATLRSLEILSSYFGQTLHRLAAQAESRRLQQNLSGIFDTLTDFIFILDVDGTVLYYNRAAAETLGYGPDILKGKPIVAVHPENLRQLAEDSMADLIADRRLSCPLPILRANGEQIMVEIRIANGYWDEKPALIAIAQDISERLQAEERQRLAASVFDNAHEGIMITDEAGKIVEVNSTFTELTGYSRAEAIGQTPDLLKSGHHEANFYDDMWQQIRRDGYWRGEIWNRKKSGEIFVEQLNISSVRNREGAISHFVAIFSDITLIKQHQQRLEHLAHFDALTQLPNRMLLGDRLQLAKAQTERSGKMLAVCYLDLDNFKPINDEYGHGVGDYLLIDVAQRLKSCVRAGDTVARLGGDEFVLLLSDLEDLRECEHAMARVLGTLAKPFLVSQRQLTISASIGVTLYPHDGSDSDTLLRHADQAMYAAKQAGRNRYHLFDPESDRRAKARRDEIGRIRQGLAAGEFRLFYQPKVNMRQGTVIGAEALIRWQHPERGLLLPDAFLPFLDGAETAVEIGDWVINEALRQIDTWRHQHGIDLAVSINISGNHLQHPDFCRRLGELLARYPGVSPQRIELEVLETAALEDIDTSAALFAECRALGVSFALDDFGTGYSSLTYFRRLPADLLKIDQSFVRDMLDNPDDLAIVEGVIGLTQAFRRSVIAEGVETVEHGLVLLLLGCDMAQGFGIARPMPADDIPAWMRQFQPDELWNLATAFNWSRDDLPMLIAEVDHKRWTRALYAYLDYTTGTASPPPVAADACRFAHWLNDAGNQRYAAIAAFQQIPALHAQVHDSARELLHRRRIGGTADLLALELALRSANDQLTECFQQIQAEVLIAAPVRRR
ncbi:EAL domain-containing protein [Dechloromonas sp. XY25]|uniref:EAL domain-containing protein n=1 Tax=Dechloromonas hankyongensis TaxID=2908002 RepID=A0ABS9JXG1_9RHOO|nr:EAL domain-containing protein [Dechloromonas hankyongensis]MCG2575596.1 EAL domain-containing protein [Dechloromonas hankyongensis]